MDPLIFLIVALVLVVLAWKFLAGMAKTVALLAILAGTAIFVFGGMG
ncbi:MAG: hypothetical protein H5U21_10235 [Porphyrobacter sp.]|nr:hypothetical protein [Porphyrobacter sp.]